MEQLQAIIFSLITAMFLGIPVSIVSGLLKNKKKGLKVIGICIACMVYGVSFYVILTSVALMGLDKSN